MGAQLWHHSASWFTDPNDALLALQGQFLSASYDLPNLVRAELQDTREVIRRSEAEGDPYELLDMYRRKLALIESVVAEGVPEDTRQRIEFVRKLRMDSGEGVGNVLDVNSVSAERDFFTAQLLNESEVGRLVGTSRPTIQQAEAAIFRINEELGRGEAVCFRVYPEGGAQTPTGWYFVGNTVD
jgi:hypothetical protein